MTALAKAIPKNKHLRMINLRHNEITEIGFHILADAIALAEGELHHMELGQNPGSTRSQVCHETGVDSGLVLEWVWLAGSDNIQYGLAGTMKLSLFAN